MVASNVAVLSFIAFTLHSCSRKADSCPHKPFYIHGSNGQQYPPSAHDRQEKPCTTLLPKPSHRAKPGRGPCTTSPTPAIPRCHHRDFQCLFRLRGRGQPALATFAWTAALAVSYAAIMFTAPLVGAYADAYGAKKKLLAITTIGCVTFTALLAFAGPAACGFAIPLIVLSNSFTAAART